MLMIFYLAHQLEIFKEGSKIFKIKTSIVILIFQASFVVILKCRFDFQEKMHFGQRR